MAQSRLYTQRNEKYPNIIFRACHDKILFIQIQTNSKQIKYFFSGKQTLLAAKFKDQAEKSEQIFTQPVH